MTDDCRIPTLAERLYGEALARAENAALEKVVAVLQETETTAAAAFAVSGIEGSAPPHGYFVASLHQKLFCILCGADPKTFAGGDPEVALAIIRNAENIARHHWGADIEPRRREPDAMA